MSDKQENGRVKRIGDRRNGTLAGGSTIRLETALKRAIASVRQMNRRQRRQSLMDAGILTSEGKLAATYR